MKKKPIKAQQKITTCLTFDDQAEEAMNRYVSVFKDAKVLNVRRFGREMPQSRGKLMTATFQIEGQNFMVMNGGPHFTFAPGISLFVNCETQAEVDELWEKLSEGGEKQPCGWIKDRFGVSWQIIPKALGELLGDPDPEKLKRVMNAMLKMKKIEIAELLAAAEPDDLFLSSLVAPARRALENNGISTLEQLSEYSEEEILTFHGLGPSSLPNLRTSLNTKGLAFRT
ncbi:VOC family protein [Persicitalea jodogahamensis]|nr:VOC family protein [Persicitalea jodogahamensis]